MTAREKEFPQKRVILPVFAEVFSFSSEKPQNKTTFASTKKGNFTRFCGSLLILTILQVFSSPTTDYTEERLSTSKCRTETSMRDTEFTLRDTEPSMRRFTKSGTSTNENGVFAIASLWRLPLFWGIKVRREGWFSILHFWKWRQGIIYMCREKEKPRLLLFGCVKSKELGFSGVLH